MVDKIKKTDAQWQEQLTPEEFEVCRRQATERAFTGRYWDTKTQGTYKCVCCGEPLFSSESKFDSGCGWPSFTAPMNDDMVEEQRDTSHGMIRVEIHCAKCDSHLGHVFDDGPQPTGLRYCVNSLSLHLDED